MNMCYHDSLDWTAAMFISATGFRAPLLVTSCLPPLAFVVHALLTLLAPIEALYVTLSLGRGQAKQGLLFHSARGHSVKTVNLDRYYFYCHFYRYYH